jgi:polar amino acid transport system substrate-binding protein
VACGILLATGIYTSTARQSTPPLLRETMQTLLIVLMLCCVAQAVSAHTVQLVTGNDYPPFTDETLQARGMITEIVELAFREVGYQADITFRPWKRGYEETKKGLFVGTFPYIKTEERLRDFHFSLPINTAYTRVFVKKDSPFTKLEDLKGKRICVPLGYGITSAIDNMLTHESIKQEGNPINLESCLRMMLSGRKDFFIINEIHGWMTIQNTFHTKEYFRTLDAVFEEISHHLIISKTYPDGEKILEQFNKGIERLKQKSVLNEIINKHLKEILN